MSKTRFLAAASHDLLQPLNAARLFVTALSERPLREKEREFATHIDRALGSVESLLGTLLDISKLDAGAVSAEKADFVIGDLISALADEYAPIAKEANLDLIALPCSLVVRSDPALLSRVLRNFISNAIRYTGPGGFSSAAAAAAGGCGSRSGTLGRAYRMALRTRFSRSSGSSIIMTGRTARASVSGLRS